MQDNILLGFLMYRPMTGYEVKKAMAAAPSSFSIPAWEASTRRSGGLKNSHW